MSISTMPDVSQNIVRLNHTPYELSYRQKYVDNKSGFFGKVEAAFNLFWLATFGRWGWRAGNDVHGANFCDIRCWNIAVANYQSAQLDLISTVANAKITRTSDKASSEHPGVRLEAPTAGDTRQRREVDRKFKAYLQALEGLTAKLAGRSGKDAAAFVWAGMKDLGNKIDKHNKAHPLDLSKNGEANKRSGHINPDWKGILEKSLPQLARESIIASVTPKVLCRAGPDFLNQLAIYYLTAFGTDVSFAAKNSFLLELRNDISKYHEKAFKELSDHLLSDEPLKVDLPSYRLKDCNAHLNFLKNQKKETISQLQALQASYESAKKEYDNAIAKTLEIGNRLVTQVREDLIRERPEILQNGGLCPNESEMGRISDAEIAKKLYYNSQNLRIDGLDERRIAAKQALDKARAAKKNKAEHIRAYEESIRKQRNEMANLLVFFASTEVDDNQFYNAFLIDDEAELP